MDEERSYEFDDVNDNAGEDVNEDVSSAFAAADDMEDAPDEETLRDDEPLNYSFDSAADETTAIASRVDEANKIVRSNIYWVAGLGVVPMPIFDLVAISGVQIKMVREISNLYGVPFSTNVVKSLIAAFIASTGSTGIARNIVCSILKMVPGIGNVLAIASMPLTCGAFTYAVGKIFIMHFESGGTLLNMNTTRYGETLSNLYKKGKDVATSCCKE